MSVGDFNLKRLIVGYGILQLVFYIAIPILLGLLFFVLVRKYGKKLQRRSFAFVWNRIMMTYHDSLKDLKEEHFSSMKEQKSTDPELREKGGLRILEIGAGSGANFEFFPPNSHLNVVEPNQNFESKFYERERKYPSLKMEKFILAKAEEMKEIEDSSVDAVVSTLVLCSVDSVEQTLSEIHRVLAPGGKFYYWEHVYDTPGTALHKLQTLLTPIWSILADNCHLNRDIDATIAKAPGFSKVEQKRFDIPVAKPAIFKILRAHVMGIATK